MSTPQGWQTPKTNWQSPDPVGLGDFNRIEGNAAAIETGERTLDPAQAPTGNVGSLRQFLDWFANRLKAITGAANWYDSPAITLAEAKSDLDSLESDLVPRSEAFLFMSIPQFQQAVQNPFLMEQMAQEFLALDVITRNPTAMDIIASSEVAMEAVAASEVAMEAVVQSEVAMAAIGQVSMAIGKLAAGLAGLDPRDYADITAVAASEVAMEAVAASEVAMEAVAASEVAMEEVAASEVAMEEVAASEVALSAIFDSWLARLAIWESETASQIIMQQARAWLEANVAEEAYRQSSSIVFAMVVDKKGLLLAIRHDYNTTSTDSWNGEMQVFAQAPTARSYTDIVGGNLALNTWYDVAYRMENFQVKNKQSGTTTRRLDFRYVPMEP